MTQLHIDGKPVPIAIEDTIKYGAFTITRNIQGGYTFFKPTFKSFIVMTIIEGVAEFHNMFIEIK
jgi:hypothetical protein